jgi:MFS family permease
MVAKVLFASSLGTIMEYYDFYAYGVAAAVAFPALYFGPLGPALGTAISLASTLLLTVGRPIGGIIFGHLGDTRGRTSSLVLALTIMGIATLAIGLLPTYEQIGVMAPALLLALRVIQGIGLGGEWGGAMTWARETVGKSRWAGFLTGGVVQTAPGWGTFMSGGISTLIILATGQAFFAAPWGSWRYIFYIGAALLALAAVIRLKLLDSPVFRMLKNTGRTVKSPVSVAFRRYWRRILIFSFLANTIHFNFPVQTYVIPFLTSKNFPMGTATLALSLSGIGTILGTLLIGFFADYFGRKRAGFIATLVTVLTVYPYYYSQASAIPALVIAGAFMFSFWFQSISGVFPSFFTESFPTQVRQTAAGLSLQITTLWSFFISFGIWTPIIAMMGAAPAFPFILLTTTTWCIIPLILWISPYVKETKGKELAETLPEQTSKF